MEFRSIIAESTPKSNWICEVCKSKQVRFFDNGEKIIKYKGDGYYFQKGEVPPNGRPIKN